MDELEKKDHYVSTLFTELKQHFTQTNLLSLNFFVCSIKIYFKLIQL